MVIGSMPHKQLLRPAFVHWDVGIGRLPSLSMISSRTPLRNALFLAVLLSALGAAAQPGKPKVVLYKDRLAAAFDTVDCVKNVIKVNPLLFFRGEIPIYYERAITPKLSIELGAGVALRDYLTLSFNGSDADDYGAGTEIVPRLSFHIGARFYFEDDLEPQGFYLQPTFSHLNYTKDIRTKGPTGELTDNALRDERVYNDLRLYAGYQLLSSNSNWMWDLYGGVGYRDRYMVIVKERLDFTNDMYTYEVGTTKDQTVALFLGVKVGMGF